MKIIGRIEEQNILNSCLKSSKLEFIPYLPLYPKEEIYLYISLIFDFFYYHFLFVLKFQILIENHFSSL